VQEGVGAWVVQTLALQLRYSKRIKNKQQTQVRRLPLTGTVSQGPSVSMQQHGLQAPTFYAVVLSSKHPLDSL
jgi:hypothetical protein